MTRTLRGKLHGKTIELDEALGVVEGQEVEVQITIQATETAARPATWLATGQAEQNGRLAAELDTEEEDRILEEIYQDRKHDVRRDVPE